ncbi:MAG: PIN domain-containing protein [Thermodesulfovibrionales bacterium]
MAKKEVKVFLDSNVIISGLFSDKGSPRIILDLLCFNLPVLIGVTGQYNIIEIERNIKKKMPEVLSLYNEYLPKLNLKIIPLPSLEKIKDLSGHISDKDIPVLASAIMGEVDFLVTGDKKDFVRPGKKGRYPFKVVTPSEFLDRILPVILKSLSPSHE